MESCDSIVVNVFKGGCASHKDKFAGFIHSKTLFVNGSSLKTRAPWTCKRPDRTCTDITGLLSDCSYFMKDGGEDDQDPPQQTTYEGDNIKCHMEVMDNAYLQPLNRWYTDKDLVNLMCGNSCNHTHFQAQTRHLWDTEDCSQFWGDETHASLNATRAETTASADRVCKRARTSSGRAF
jgi:hypothetical protein